MYIVVQGHVHVYNSAIHVHQSVLLTACTIELSTVPFMKLADEIGLVLIKEGCFHSWQTAMPNLSLLMCINSVPQHKYRGTSKIQYINGQGVKVQHV